MSTLAKFQRHVNDLLFSTYSNLDDLGQKNVWNAASVLIENELKIKPIENERFVTRYVSIEPDDHLKVISDYERTFHQKYDVNQGVPKGLINLLLKKVKIEVMPKVNLADKISFAEFLDLSYNAISEVGRFYAEPLVVGGISEEPRYQKKSFLHYVFEKHNEKSRSGFLIIGESQDGNHFDYPRFKQYSAPTILFDLFRSPDFHISALEKIYSKLQNFAI